MSGGKKDVRARIPASGCARVLKRCRVRRCTSSGCPVVVGCEGGGGGDGDGGGGGGGGDC